jgi:hypothetical protein
MAKILIILLSLSFSAAFAGTKTCYSATQAVPSSLPSELCLTAVGVYNDGDHEWVTIYGGNLAGDYVFFPDSDWNHWLSEKPLFNSIGDVCGAEETALLKVRIPGEPTKIEAGNLELTISHTVTRDTCHLEPQTTEYRYSLGR